MSGFGPLIDDNPNRKGFSALPVPSLYQQTALWPVPYKAGTAIFGFNPSIMNSQTPYGFGDNYAQQVGSVYQPFTEWPDDPRAGMISDAPIPGPSNFGGVKREVVTFDLTADMGSPYQIFEQTRR